MSTKIITGLLTSIRQHSTYQVFSDFVEIVTIICQKASLHILASSTAMSDKLEDNYSRIIKKYSKDDLETLTKIYATFMQEIQNNYNLGYYKDILGEIYTELNLNDKHKQQFFTPSHVSRFMGEIVGIETSDLLEEKKFISVADECCGCGGMLLKFAETAKNKGIDPSSQIFFYAKDIDRIMAMATYIQLYHYALPCIVDCGDALLGTTSDRWVSLTCALQWYKFSSIFDGSNNNAKAGKSEGTTINETINITTELSLF